ncbi:MAG: type II secretion system protein [Planctomycetota bacterium]
MNTAAPRHCNRRVQRRRGALAAGYTLLEVLVALSVLAVALTVTASLFPAAALLQKQARDDAEMVRRARTAESMLTGRQLDHTLLWNYFGDPPPVGFSPISRPNSTPNPANYVYPLAEVDVVYDSSGTRTATPQSAADISDTRLDFDPWRNDTAASSGPSQDFREQSYLWQWPESDRAMPSFVTPRPLRATPGSGPNGLPEPLDLSDRDTFWVPLVQRGPEANRVISDWRVYVFLMRRDNAEETFPNIYGLDAAGDTTNQFDINQVGEAELIANPWDSPAFPKVFWIRADLTGLDDSPLLELEILSSTNIGNQFVQGTTRTEQPVIDSGDLVLGDNGGIYRVAQRSAENPDVLLVSIESSPVYDKDDLPLTGVWYARPSEPGARSPVRDIKLLSQSAVQD